MNEENFVNLLQNIVDQPFLFMVIIILTTFILEDLATTGAAIITSQTDVSLFIPLTALFIGIVLGDIGLYYLGWLSRRFKFFKKFENLEKTEKAKRLLDKNLLFAIFISRFIPGMRLPTYMAIGAFNISFQRFFLIIVFAVALWGGGLFALFYTIGDSAKEVVGNLKWSGLGILLAVFILGPHLVNKFLKTTKSP